MSANATYNEHIRLDVIYGMEKKMAELPEKAASQGAVQYINPEDLTKNPSYTNVVVVTGCVKTIYIGAQLAFDAASGTIVGKGDIRLQTEQTLKTLDAALRASGAQREHVIKWTIYIVQGQPIGPGVAAFQEWWGNRPNAPTNTVIFVPEFVPADFLVAIEAIAVIPEES